MKMALGGVMLLLANIAISALVVELMASPKIVTFDMKRTVDTFMQQAAKRNLSQGEVKALVERFSSSLQQTVSIYQKRHHVIVVVKPAIIAGADDVTEPLQAQIADNMRAK